MDENLRATDEMMAEGPLLFGRVLDGEGGARAIGWEAAQSWRRGLRHEVLWLHFDRTVPGMQAWLESHGIPEPTAELLTSDETRPRAFREGEALVATLRGVNFNPGAEPEDMVSIQVWSDGARVFTLRRHSMQTTREVAGELDQGHGPRDAGGLITLLIERMIVRMNHSIVDMNDAIDKLELAPVDADPAGMLAEITVIRHNCLGLQRHMAPQHDALEAIRREAPKWFEDHDRREIAEAIDRLRRYLDDIDISKESAVVLVDELRAFTAARSQRTNFLLTGVASIFLPLTFLTGLSGMNVVGIPYANHPWSFWVIVAVCAAIALAQVWLFRRWKWL
jgi:zinc transporter